MKRLALLAIPLLSMVALADIEKIPSMDDEKYNVELTTGLIPTQVPKLTTLTYDDNGNPNYWQLYGYTFDTESYTLEKAIDGFDKVMDSLMATGIFQKNAPDWKWDDGSTIDMAQRAMMSSTYLSMNLQSVIGALSRYCQDMSKKVNLNAGSWRNLQEKVDRMDAIQVGITQYREQIGKEVEEAIKNANEELVKRVGELETDLKELKEKQSDITELRDTTIPEIQGRLSNLESDIAAIDTSTFAQYSDIAGLTADIASSQSSVAESLTQISTLNDAITTHSQTLITLLSSIDDIQVRLTDTSITEQERSQLMSQIESISSQIEGIQASVSSTQSQGRELQDGIAAQSASIEGLLSQIDAAKEAIESLKSQRTELEASKEQIQTELETARTRLATIEGTASEQERLINQNQQNISSASLLLAALQKSVDAIGAGATKETVQNILQPLIVGGIMSPADSNYTNAMYNLVKYLGVDDSDSSVTNSGMTFVAPKVNGRQANDILDYLNMNGVVGYQSENSEGSTNFPFAARFESSGMNTVATFGAPLNWIDGSTIKIDANGVYHAQVPTPEVTTPWHWTTNGFVRPYVYAGNQIVTASGANVTSAGEYYVHVTMSQTQGGASTVSAYVDTSSQVSEDSWTFWVGTLQQVTHEVDGEAVSETICTAELGVMPVILCYE